MAKQGLHHERPDDVTLIAILKHYYNQHGQHVRIQRIISRTITILSEIWPAEPVSVITIQEQERLVRHLRDRG